MQDCPLYTEYFTPFKQRAQRTVQGFLSSIGRKLKGIFGGKFGGK